MKEQYYLDFTVIFSNEKGKYKATIAGIKDFELLDTDLDSLKENIPTAIEYSLPKLMEKENANNWIGVSKYTLVLEKGVNDT